MSRLATLLLGVTLGVAGTAIAFLHLSLDLSKYALSAFLILAIGSLIAVIGLALFSSYMRHRLDDGPKLLVQLLESIHAAVVEKDSNRETALANLKGIGVSVVTTVLTTLATIRAFGLLFAALTVAVSAAILVATLMQVERLDQQNQLVEASRRAALINELTALLTEIDEEMDQLELKGVKDSSKKSPPRAGEGPTFVRDGISLSKRLVWRIVALSRSLKPYRFLEGITLSNTEYSPERAQLLISLVASGIDMKDIFRMGSFEYSYMKGVELSNIFLGDAKLNNSSFEGANLITSNLSGSIARDTDFSGAILFMVDMTNADIQNSKFFGTRMPEPHQLAGAKMNDANLDGALVSSVDWIQNLISQKTPPTGFEASQWEISSETVEWRFNKQKAGIAYVLRRKSAS
jgi:hypothetical protein